MGATASKSSKKTTKRAPARKAAAPSRRVRKVKFTPELARQITERIAKGEPLESICRDAAMPESRTVHRWVNPDERPPGVPESFASDFACARARGFDAIAAECLRIADTPLEGVETTIDEKGVSEKRGDMLGHRKLQIETRLKLLAKWDPKRYGDKLAVGGADDLPAVKTENVTDNELARRLAFALTKGLQQQQKGGSE